MSSDSSYLMLHHFMNKKRNNRKYIKYNLNKYTFLFNSFDFQFNCKNRFSFPFPLNSI